MDEQEEKCEHCGMPMSQCTCNKSGDAAAAPAHEGAPAEGAVGGEMPPQ